MALLHKTHRDPIYLGGSKQIEKSGQEVEESQSIASATGGTINEALVNRGSLTFWFDEEAMRSWGETERTGRRGAPARYSDYVAMQCALTLGVVFRLPLRATEGLVRSVLELIGLPLPTPDYTTLCRRRGSLEVELPRRLA